MIIIDIVSITKNEKVYEYRYYAPKKNDTLKDVALRDMNDLELTPKFWYNGIENSFSFDNKKENANKSFDYKDIILSGSLIWAKYYIK